MARQPETLIRWLDAERLAENWLPSYFAPCFDRLDQALHEAGDQLRTLGELVATAGEAQPEPPAEAEAEWVVYRDNGRLIVDRADRHPEELGQATVLPRQAVLLALPVVRNLEVVYWGEEVFGGKGVVLQSKEGGGPSVFALQVRPGACDPAWFAGELQGELVRLQVRRMTLGGLFVPVLGLGDLFALKVVLPPHREQERAAAAVRRRTAALFGVEPVEAERPLVASGATFEERLHQFEDYVLDQSWVDRQAAYFLESSGGPEGEARLLIRPLDHRHGARTGAPELRDGPRLPQELPVVQEDPAALAAWWRWYFDPTDRVALFNHLDGPIDLPAAAVQSTLRRLGPPPVPVGWVPPFAVWRAIVNEHRDRAGLGPGSWPDVCRTWALSATQRSRQPPVCPRVGDKGHDPAFVVVTRWYYSEGRERRADHEGSEPPDEVLTNQLSGWLRSFYRPGLALKVLREGTVVGAILLFGPDQTDDPVGARARLEAQGAGLADALERAVAGGDDAFRRELIRRMSDVMHNLNGPIGRIVSALGDVEQFLKANPAVANTIILKPKVAQGRAAMAARMESLRRGSRGHGVPAGPDDGGSRAEHNEEAGAGAEQSSLLARIEVAARNIRLIQKASEQINQLRRVQNELEKEPLDIAELARRAAMASQDGLPGLTVLLPDQAQAVLVQGNRDTLQRAVEQVLENAVRELKCRDVAGPLVRVSVDRVGTEAVLTIADNGLPPHVQLIRQPFKEGATTYNHLNMGNGIGLSYVLDVIRAHGGNCSLRENRDERGGRLAGVTFEARLPLPAVEGKGG